MQTFSGMQYVAIDIANHYGKDKLLWSERIQWVKDNINCLESLVYKAESPYQYEKAVNALRMAQRGEETGFIMSLDACSSGIQLMSALSGCKQGAKNCGLINTGRRENFYGNVNNLMDSIIGSNVSANFEYEDTKKAGMTVFYGSTYKPKSVFGENTPAYRAFYKALNSLAPGPMQLMKVMQSKWDSSAKEHTWVMPDKFFVRARVKEKIDKRIEVDELNHATFTHRAKVVLPANKGLSLAANIIHSIDAWIVREMYRTANRQKILISSIHDSFWCRPNDMNFIRKLYIEILARIAKSNLIGDILNQIANENKSYKKRSTDLHKYIMKSEYALS